jgi:hypothetical protein
MEGRSNQPSTVGVGFEIGATRVNEFGRDEWVEHGRPPQVEIYVREEDGTPGEIQL